MDAENQAEDLFARAYELSGKARETFLVEACGGNAELHLKVQGLLAVALKADSFFGDEDGATLGAEEFRDTCAEKEGDPIGPYKLHQRIGEGGFGNVWMAEQSVPMSRMVALKVIKAGMDTKQVLTRFEAERQALAMMDHPNIAKVLDAGATASGRPWFAMELVKGIPITRFCDQQGLDTRERLALFGDVCSAINHAHQKGVIHRDIKPSNVMVTLHGDKPVVKVIDFGIAKATQGKLTDQTLFTKFEQMIGTPVYMSPEQAGLSGLDVDTRSDIYALGILLYELLVGKPPFDSNTLVSAGYEEMRRIIREVEPDKPSSRITSMAVEERTQFAKARHIEPGKVGRLVEPDLDWIVMKAIEKDRARRYETANAFAQDIVRFLSDEPVAAGPPSVTYRMRKFVRRNRRALLSGAAAVAALLVGLALAAGIWLDATFEKNERVARALDLIGQAERQLEWNAAADFDDDGHFREARELERRLEEALAGIGHSDEVTRTRREQLRQAVATEERNRKLVAAIEDVMMKDISSLGSTRPDAQAKAHALATAFAEFGITPLNGQVAETVERITIGRETLQDRMLAGLAAWSAALEESNPEQSARLEEIIDRADTDPWRRELRQAIKSGNAAALEALAERTEISAQPTMTVLRLFTALDEKQLAGALEKLLRRAQREAPASFWTNFSLGLTLATSIRREEVGDVRDKMIEVGGASFGKGLPGLVPDPTPVKPEFDEAVGFLRAAAAARPDALGAWQVLGIALNASGHLDEAIATYQEAASRFPDGDHLDLFLSQALLGQNRREEALPHLRRAAERDPADDWLHLTLGGTLAELGEYEEARTALLNAARLAAEETRGAGETEEIRERKEPLKVTLMGKEAEFNEELAYLTLAIVQSGRGDSEEALASSQLALGENPNSAAAHALLGMERLNTSEWREAELSIRKSLELDPELAAAHNFFGTILMSRSDFNGAVVSFRRAIELDPKDATAHSNLGASLGQLGKTQEALGSHETALDLAPEYALGWNNLGVLLDKQGNPEKAMECFRKAVSFDPNLSLARSNIARMLWIAGKHEESIAAYRQLNDAEAYTKFAAVLVGEEKIEEAIDAAQRAIALKPDLAVAHHALGHLYLRAGRYKDAIEPFRTSIRLAPGMSSAHNQLGLALLFQQEYEEAIDSIMNAIMLEENSKPFRNSLLAALLSSGRITAAGVAHGNCGNAGCSFDFMLEKDKQVREILEKDGPGALELPVLLGAIYDKFSRSTFAMAEHPAYTDAELRAVWDERREEIARRLGSASVRLIQIRKPSDKHPGANQEALQTIAADILRKLNEGDDFTEMAEKHSDGWAEGKPEAVTYGDLPEQLNAAAFSLEEGGFTRDLIEDEHAIYLLKIESREAGKAENFDDPKVRAAIKALLAEQRRREWEQRYLARVRDTAPDLVMARVQNMAAERLLEDGEEKRAEDLFRNALATFKHRLRADDPVTLKAEENLARCTARPEKPATAGPVAELSKLEPDEAKSIDSALKLVDDLKEKQQQDDDLAMAMLKLGHAYQIAGRLDEALTSFLEAEELARNLHTGNHAVVSAILFNIGETLRQQRRYGEAVEQLEKSLAIDEDLKAQDSALAKTHNALGNTLGALGEYTKAEQHLKQALDLSLKVWGENHRSVADAYNHLGLNLSRRGDVAGAKEMCLKALKIDRFPEALSNLGLILVRLAEYDEAKKLLREAIDILETREDFSSRLALAMAWNHLGLALHSEGRKEEAKPLYEKALELQVKAGGGGHPGEGSILSNLGLLLTGAEAVQMQEQALKIERESIGPGRDHDGLVVSLSNLAIALISSGDLSEAKERAEESLAMARRLHPDELHQSVGIPLLVLSQIQVKLEEFDAAERSARDGVGILRKVLPPSHPTMGEGLIVHAQAVCEYSYALGIEGRRAEAIALLRKTLGEVALVPGLPDLNLASLHGNLGSLLAVVGELEESEKELKLAVRMFEAEVKQVPELLAPALLELAFTRQKLDKLEEAEADSLKALEICRNLPKGKSALPGFLTGHAKILYESGKAQGAEKFVRQALSLYEDLPPDNPLELGHTHRMLGLTLADQKRHAEAESKFREAIGIHVKAGAEATPRMADLLAELAESLKLQGKGAEALKERRGLVELTKILHGQEHLAVASAQYLLAVELYDQGSFVEAEKNDREALAMRRKLLGAKHHDVAVSLNHLALTLREQSKLPEAEGCAREAFDMASDLSDIDEQTLAAIMNTLGTILSGQARYPEAERMIRKSLEVTQELQGGEDLKLAVCHASLASALSEQGKYAEAEEQAQIALDMTIRLKGENDPSTLACLHNLAGVFSDQKKHVQAEDAYRRVLRGMEMTLGPDHPMLDTILSNLAGTLSKQDKLDEAEQMLRKSLRLQKEKSGFEHPTSKNGLAKVLRDRGKYEEADALFRNVLVEVKEMFGPAHPNLAKVMAAYAISLEKQEKFDEAKLLAENALAIQEKGLPPGHPDLAETLDLLSSIHTRIGNKEEAAKYDEKAKVVRNQTEVDQQQE